MNISGAQIVDLQVHEDDRGILYEFVCAARHGSVVQHSYMVRNRAAGVVRAFHLHRRQHDWVCVVHGAALIVLVQDKESDRLVLSGDRPKLLHVPPRVHHGWMSLEPDTMLLTATSLPYDAEDPDDSRVPPNTFDDMLGGSPWEIKHR